MRPLRSSVLVLVALLAAGAASPAAPVAAAPVAAPPVTALVRVDQLGYAPGESKQAYLMTSAASPGARFTVWDAAGRLVLAGRAGTSLGSWNARFPAVYPLDFSRLDRPGTYRIAVGDLSARSAPFQVAPAGRLWRPRVADAVAFFQAQRDGADVLPGPLRRQPAHLNDAAAGVYAHPAYEDPDSDVIVGDSLRRIGGPVDLEGGWFDAGDFIKFTHTTAYADSLLLVAQRDLGRTAPATLDREIRFGLDWLGKAWDPAHNRLYIQVGIGSGNSAGTFAGDHDLWRLPEADDSLTGAENRYLSHRPAFGTDAGPGRLAPNLAGRVAATFALAAQVDAVRAPARARAELALAAQVFSRAKTTGVTEADVVTALPHAFYPESAWRDDLELGATELARAGYLLHDRRAAGWLATAGHWASAYLATEAGGDTLNLYDDSALAHAELIPLLRAHRGHLAVTPARLVADLRAQLAIGQARAAADPFRAAGNYDDFDVASHTFGLVATAALYRQATGSRAYDRFASEQRNWVLGANPWGMSMMIGVGSTFADCPQHVVANLAGSLDGSRPVLRGAVVNGPNDASLFDDGLGDFFDTGRTCPPAGGDRYAAFTGHGSRLVDDVRSWQTVEPALDFTATAALAFALIGR
ncbi:MAG TPA: glycoside hydrolase family 9 protein [Mycobacteriales bacterium]|nr:glycoside hydrolase family 9 protein [Mycobacteriales bacterium]